MFRIYYKVVVLTHQIYHDVYILLLTYGSYDVISPSLRG